ncbi:toxin-activating lysine-acyltransferase [Pseudohalocynthiibacter aestuariivivens]|nr:toxin-activating lysine-acyltransferase [Pseudohalocynthiibacter aestuariivivens]QIE45342.1 toxin-activating lysine-acyltransferase [Pseudohalocynthiibacter aestuariivivens]
MRHLAALDHVRPGPASDAPPYPDDWFDLPQDALADLGAMTYLLSLSSYHATMPLSEATAHLEVALRLGQYRIFRSGGFPRGFVTWAGLADGAERRFALHHKPLMPRHWNSGPSKWMIDFVAPFGHTREILRVLASNPNESRVRTLWHNAKGTRYRIIEWARPAPGAPIGVRSFGVGQFARHLEAV